mgnify:FL=1
MNFKNLRESSPIQQLSLLVLAVVFGVFTTSCNPDETQVVANFTSTITLQEEFDGALDESIWGYEEGTGVNGWGNNELQHYTNRADNVVIEDGMLKITAIKEAYEGAEYTSARLLTKGKFEQQYGRVEARIKLPSGKGLWPAFWMLGSNFDVVGWPQCGEIDIMENKGSEPTIVAGSLHGPGYSGGNPVTKQFQLTNDRFENDFHIFGIEWTKDYVNHYVDGVLYNHIIRDDVPGEWVFDQPFYIILNLAVGGNFDGAPTDATIFPNQMLVDYVRVYAAN